MNKLSYETLKNLGFRDYLLKDAPERMLQFGEGNFLRAFVDYFVDVLNEKADFNCKIVLCQPIEHGLCDMINEQEGLYTLYLRGYQNGEKVNHKRVISSVSRCINPYNDFDELMNIAKNPDLQFIASNTTEAGIAYDGGCAFSDRPQNSFPAKLTRFLYERFVFFNGDSDKGTIILSCELIDNNGEELEKIVLRHAKEWELGEEFINWLEQSNKFCSTLVDRIVTGFPRDEADEINNENGYVDNLIDTGEAFGFWVIEGDEEVKKALPCEKAGLPIVITDNHKPYKERKVRILNGAHTTLVLGAFLGGKDIVRDCMEDDVTREFMNNTIFEEIIPTLSLERKELEDFANSVIDRFNNPFINHELLSISLNSTSKWRARVLPSLLEYVEKKQEIPKRIAASFAFYIAFYSDAVMRDGDFFGMRNGVEYKIFDDKEVLDFYSKNRNIATADLVKKVCEKEDFWGRDLSKIDGFLPAVTEYMQKIEKVGCYELMRELA